MTVVFVTSTGAPRRANANTYNSSYTVDPASFNCGYFGTTEACDTYYKFATSQSSSQGDVYNISVSFTSPLFVPGSASGNFVYSAVTSNSSKAGVPISGPDTSSFYSSVSGYSSKSTTPPITGGPFSNKNSDGYGALVGFCCGYGVPNDGFTAGGFSTSTTLESNVPGETIYGEAVGYVVYLPSAPTDLGDFAGGTVNDPAILPSGSVGSLEGDIGGAAKQQVYAFDWNGGLFDTIATMDPSTISPGNDYSFEVLSTGGSLLASGPLLNQLNGTSEIKDILAPGTYLVGLIGSQTADPGFKIAFETPLVTSAAPEPSAWMLIIVGLGALGALLRARHRFRALSALALEA